MNIYIYINTYYIDMCIYICIYIYIYTYIYIHCCYVIPGCRNSSRQLWFEFAAASVTSKKTATACCRHFWVQWPVWNPFLCDVYVHQQADFLRYGKLIIINGKPHVPAEISWVGPHAQRWTCHQGHAPWVRLHTMFVLASGVTNYKLLCSNFLCCVVANSHPTQILVLSRSFRKMRDVRRRQGPVGPGDGRGQGPVEAWYKLCFPGSWKSSL